MANSVGDSQGPILIKSEVPFTLALTRTTEGETVPAALGTRENRGLRGLGNLFSVSGNLASGDTPLGSGQTNDDHTSGDYE